MSESSFISKIQPSWIYTGHLLHTIAPQLLILLIKILDSNLSTLCFRKNKPLRWPYCILNHATTNIAELDKFDILICHTAFISCLNKKNKHFEDF